MRKTILMLVAVAGMTAEPAHAQMVDVPIWSNGILGQQALRTAHDNYNDVHGIDPDETDASPPKKPCSLDAMPASDRRAMEQEYGVAIARTVAPAPTPGYANKALVSG